MLITVGNILAALLLCGGQLSLASVWHNLGPNECNNGLKMETCGYGEFCSEDRVKRGCRNCTDPAFFSHRRQGLPREGQELDLTVRGVWRHEAIWSISWEVGAYLYFHPGITVLGPQWSEDKLEEFRTRFPSCEVFLREKLWKRREIALQNQTDTQTTEIHELQDLIEELYNWRLVLLPVVTIVTVILIVVSVRYLQLRQENKILRQQTGSADMSPSCFTRKSGKSLAQAGADGEGDISTCAKLSMVGEEGERRPTPTAPIPTTDSGHASETDSLTESHHSSPC